MGLNIQEGQESTLWGDGASGRSKDFLGQCRPRLDPADKLTAKCWLCVPDRASLLCYHPGPPTPLSLSVPGVWRQGPGLKNVEEKERTHSSLPLPPSSFLWFPLGASKSCGEFCCFCCAKPESHLLRCRCKQRVSSRCNTVSPTNKHFAPPRPLSRAAEHGARVTAEVTPGWARSGLVFGSCTPLCQRLNISEVARRQGGIFFFLSEGGSGEKGARGWVRQHFVSPRL